MAHEVAHRQPRVPRPVRAAEDSTHPCEQLVVDEGLPVRVIVCSRPERLVRADPCDAEGEHARQVSGAVASSKRVRGAGVSDPLDPE
jgi:hypothetical protein